MQKNIIVYFVSCVCLFLIICILFWLFQREKIQEPLKEKFYTHEIVAHEKNCELYVNDVKIDDKHYVKINYEQQYVELPLLTTLEALGADIQMKKNFIFIQYKDKIFEVKPNDRSFGLYPTPGTTNAVRKICGDELIVDSKSTGIFTKMMEATIEIDYCNSVVKISQKQHE